MKQKFLISKCIHQFVHTIEAANDALTLNDGSHDVRRRLFLDNYPSIVIVLSTYLLQYNDSIVKITLKKYILKEIAALNKQKIINLSLCYGLTGVAYSLKLAAEVLPDLVVFMHDFDILYARLAKAQITQTNQIIKNRGVAEKDYDLIQGMTSCLAYLSQFGSSQNDVDIEKRIVALFDWLLQDSNQGLPHALIKNSNIIDDGRRNFFKEGYINLGLSHGLAGPLAALASIPNTKVLGKITTLYADLFNQNQRITSPWTSEVSAQELKLNQFVTHGIDRASWCYGNPGIARTVYRVAKKQKNKELERVAVDYFIGLKDLSLNQLQLESPTVCHGISGLLLILNAMERDTGVKEIGVVKQKMMSYLLAQANFDNNLVFKEYDFFFRGEKYDKPRYFKDIGVLNGSGGIILTLMSLQSRQRLDWERILLIS